MKGYEACRQKTTKTSSRQCNDIFNQRASGESVAASKERSLLTSVTGCAFIAGLADLTVVVIQQRDAYLLKYGIDCMFTPGLGGKFRAEAEMKVGGQTEEVIY